MIEQISGVDQLGFVTSPNGVATSVLLLEPNPDMRTLSYIFLTEAGYQVITCDGQCNEKGCQGCDTAWEAAAGDWKMIIVGCQTPEKRHIEVVGQLLQVMPRKWIPLAMFSEGALGISSTLGMRLREEGLAVLIERDWEKLLRVVGLSSRLAAYRQEDPNFNHYPPFMETEFPLLADGWTCRALGSPAA